MLETITAGDNIASYCTKCKLNLDHAVVAMTGEAIVKVKCKTCSSVHKFKDPADVKKPRIAKKKVDAVKTAETLWETSLSETKGKERAYDMSGKYRIGDIVLHNTFGKGIVRKLYLNKCDMLFKDKERLMASANQ
jgi:CxxC motif-containing protein